MTAYRYIDLSDERMRGELLPRGVSITRKNSENAVGHYVVVGRVVNEILLITDLLPLVLVWRIQATKLVRAIIWTITSDQARTLGTLPLTV